jgi:hypothetical protein
MKHAIRRLTYVVGAAWMLLSGIAPAADGPGLTRDKVAAWLEGYEEAWNGGSDEVS